MIKPLLVYIYYLLGSIHIGLSIVLASIIDRDKWSLCLEAVFCAPGIFIIWTQILTGNLLMIDMQLTCPGIHEDSYIA